MRCVRGFAWQGSGRSVVVTQCDAFAMPRHTGEALVRGGLLRLGEVDAHLAPGIAARSPGPIELAVHLLKVAVQVIVRDTCLWS